MDFLSVPLEWFRVVCPPRSHRCWQWSPHDWHIARCIWSDWTFARRLVSCQFPLFVITHSSFPIICLGSKKKCHILWMLKNLVARRVNTPFGKNFSENEWKKDSFFSWMFHSKNKACLSIYSLSMAEARPKQKQLFVLKKPTETRCNLLNYNPLFPWKLSNFSNKKIRE